MNPPTAKETRLADRPAEVKLAPPVPLAKGYRDYERHRLELACADGAPIAQTRDLLRGGRVAAVLPIDPARGEIVLIRQFRLAAHLANGRGEMVELVAGRAEAKENLAQTAQRECLEEIGLAPRALVELFTFLPTPGLTDEAVTLFLGVVDATNIPDRAGAAGEHELLEPMRVAIDDAISALPWGNMCNGILILALQWLALNRDRLDDVVRAARPAAP